jgi:hypothetical protein
MYCLTVYLGLNYKSHEPKAQRHKHYLLAVIIILAIPWPIIPQTNPTEPYKTPCNKKQPRPNNIIAIQTTCQKTMLQNQSEYFWWINICYLIKVCSNSLLNCKSAAWPFSFKYTAGKQRWKQSVRLVFHNQNRYTSTELQHVHNPS